MENKYNMSGDYDRTKFAKNITMLRLHKGLTQKEVSDELNISISTYSLYEQGKTTPTIDKLHKIVQYYKISSDLLMYADTYDLICFTMAGVKNNVFLETLTEKCALMSDENKGRVVNLINRINAEKK